MKVSDSVVPLSRYSDASSVLPFYYVLDCTYASTDVKLQHGPLMADVVPRSADIDIALPGDRTARRETFDRRWVRDELELQTLRKSVVNVQVTEGLNSDLVLLMIAYTLRLYDQCRMCRV